MSIGLRRQSEAWDHARPYVRALLAMSRLHGRIVELQSMAMTQEGYIEARWIVFVIPAQPDVHLVVDSDGWVEWAEIVNNDNPFAVSFHRASRRVRLDERSWPMMIERFFVQPYAVDPRMVVEANA